MNKKKMIMIRQHAGKKRNRGKYPVPDLCREGEPEPAALRQVPIALPRAGTNCGHFSQFFRLSPPYVKKQDLFSKEKTTETGTKWKLAAWSLLPATGTVSLVV